MDSIIVRTGKKELQDRLGAAVMIIYQVENDRQKCIK